MKIFVTGASGFVGGAATRKLVERGYEVRAMSRRPASDALIVELGAQPVRCDLESISASHIADADVVLHCAAYVDAWGPKNAWYHGNVQGTRSVLAAAQSAGVKRFIHIGTEAGLVYGQHITGADEGYPLAPDSPYPYCATKAQAEVLVRTAATENFFTIVLRPRFIWGPGDTTLLPAIEEMNASGNWCWINHGKARTSTTHIDNLVQGIELALVRGRSGEAYFVLDNETSTLRQMISGMADSKGMVLPDRSIPIWLADAAGFTCEAVWRLFGLKRAPPITRHAAMVMSRDCVLNDNKARRELGYAPTMGVQEGLQNLAG